MGAEYGGRGPDNPKTQKNIASKIFFFKNHPENKTGRPVPDLFLFFEKAFYEVKTSRPQLRFRFNLIVLHVAYNKNKVYET